MAGLLIYVVIVVILAWLATWVIAQLPGVPGIITNLIWVVAVVIIFVMLLTAFGVGLHSGPGIPRV